MRFEKIGHNEAMLALADVEPWSHGKQEKCDEALADLKMPCRSTANSAGYDFHSPITVNARAGDKVKIPLLVKVVDMPSDVVLLVFNRSGLSLRGGLRLDNAVGVIDADYDKCIWFQATANQDILIRKGDRICQGIFLNFLKVDDDDASGDRTGGFGSTGK